MDEEQQAGAVWMQAMWATQKEILCRQDEEASAGACARVREMMWQKMCANSGEWERGHV